MFQSRKQTLKRKGNVNKETVRRETAKLFAQFLQTDLHRQVPSFHAEGPQLKFESREKDIDNFGEDLLHYFVPRAKGLRDGIPRRRGLSSDGARRVPVDLRAKEPVYAMGMVVDSDDSASALPPPPPPKESPPRFASSKAPEYGPTGPICLENHFLGDQEDKASYKSVDEFQEEVGEIAEETDTAHGVAEDPLTALEQEIVHELRRVAEDIDQNLMANVRQAAKQITGLVAYNSFRSTLQQCVGNLVGWTQIAVVFQFTERAVRAADAGGSYASQIKENCLRYIEDTCADWIVRQGGYESILSDDSGDSSPDVD